jgi:NDP-sugar pyrophosphorylase family protein
MTHVPEALQGTLGGKVLTTGMGKAGHIARKFASTLCSTGTPASYVHPGFWSDFGTPLDYLNGSLQLLSMDANQRLRVATMDPIEVLGDATVALGTGADFHAGVELVGGVALGFASLVAEGARIEDSVIMPEAWIGPGSQLKRVIVGTGTEVPAGFRGEDVLVCSDLEPGAGVPADTERSGGLLVRPLDREARVLPRTE